MKKTEITGKYDGKKILNYLKDTYPDAPESAFHKGFRKKDIKVNKKPVSKDYILRLNDMIEVYINDNILYNLAVKKDDELVYSGFDIVYEDDNLLIVDKKQGILSQSFSGERNVEDNVKLYLGSQVHLCHRLDRNTGGLLVLAKNTAVRDIIFEKMKTNEIRKKYICLVSGKPDKPSDTLKAYLEKDEKNSRVYIKDKFTPISREIVTRYKVLSSNKNISRLEVELITGRTHQIRSHLAYSGYPVIGDGKYGVNEINRRQKKGMQCLWAYKIFFDFKSDAGLLNYLNGREIKTTPPF